MSLYEADLISLRKDILQLFKDGIKAVDAYESVKNHFNLKNNIISVSNINGSEKQFDIHRYKNIYVVGAGKASAKMADAVWEILSGKVSESLIITKYGFSASTINNQIIEAAHPVPDSIGVSATKEIVKICEKADEDDLIIFLLSGGASALLSLPGKNISLSDLQQLNELLLSSGLEISEMNIIRKQISKVKGGKLADIAKPANIITLAVSDVLGDAPEIIGSAPSIHDSSTIEDAYKILMKHNLMNQLPNSIREFILNHLEEKPSYNRKILSEENSNYFIVANNQMALNAIKLSAEKYDYKSSIVSNHMKGEARLAAKEITDYILKSRQDGVEKKCFIYGGETTVTIKGKGKGGRNQELCLAAAIQLDGAKNVVLLSGGTDGNDGPTDVAGAICDGKTIERAKRLKLNAGSYLADNDSYTFFSQLKDLVQIPVTQTNVMDVVIVLTL